MSFADTDDELPLEDEADDAALPGLLSYAPGLYDNIPNALYHRRELGIASKSALDRLALSPAEYYAWVTGQIPDNETKARFVGKGFHCALLEPERFADEYVVVPDFGKLRKHDASGTTTEQGRENKARRAEWLARNTGRTYIPAELATMLAGMQASLARPEHAKARRLLMGGPGRTEATIRWEDPASGLACKGRPDRITELADIGRIAIDVKTIEDASERSFIRAAEMYGYGRQAPFYKDGLDAVGHGVDHFVFVVFMKTPPYLIGCYSIENEETGREANAILLDRMADCLARETWPGLPDKVIPVRVRSWIR